MILEYLRVERNASYAPRPGEYKGTMKFQGDHGSVEIPLDEELSQEVLKLCAESLTRATKTLASTLTAEMISQVVVVGIEDKS